MWSVVRSIIQTVFVVSRGSACVIPRLRRIRRKGVVVERSDPRRRAERAVHHPASFLFNWYALPVMVRRPCIYSIFILRRIAFIRNAFARLMLYMIAFARIIGQSTNVYGRNSFLFVPFSPCSTVIQANWDVVPFMVRRTKRVSGHTQYGLNRGRRYFSLLLR